MDHWALKHLNNSSKVNCMHARWIAYIQKFTFSFRHKSSQLNKVVAALNHRVILLISIRNKIVNFDYLKDLYVDNVYFKEEWHNYVNGFTRKRK